MITLEGRPEQGQTPDLGEPISMLQHVVNKSRVVARIYLGTSGNHRTEMEYVDDRGRTRDFDLVQDEHGLRTEEYINTEEGRVIRSLFIRDASIEQHDLRMDRVMGFWERFRPQLADPSELRYPEPRNLTLPEAIAFLQKLRGAHIPPKPFTAKAEHRPLSLRRA